MSWGLASCHLKGSYCKNVGNLWYKAHLQGCIKTGLWFGNNLPLVEPQNFCKRNPANFIFVLCEGWWKHGFCFRMKNWTAVKDSWGQMRIDEQIGLVFTLPLTVSVAIFVLRTGRCLHGHLLSLSRPSCFSIPTYFLVEIRFRRQWECLWWLSIVLLWNHRSQM